MRGPSGRETPHNKHSGSRQYQAPNNATEVESAHLVGKARRELFLWRCEQNQLVTAFMAGSAEPELLFQEQTFSISYLIVAAPKKSSKCSSGCWPIGTMRPLQSEKHSIKRSVRERTGNNLHNSCTNVSVCSSYTRSHSAYDACRNTIVFLDKIA